MLSLASYWGSRLALCCPELQLQESQAGYWPHIVLLNEGIMIMIAYSFSICIPRPVSCKVALKGSG